MGCIVKRCRCKEYISELDWVLQKAQQFEDGHNKPEGKTNEKNINGIEPIVDINNGIGQCNNRREGRQT